MWSAWGCGGPRRSPAGPRSWPQGVHQQSQLWASSLSTFPANIFHGPPVHSPCKAATPRPRPVCGPATPRTCRRQPKCCYFSRMKLPWRGPAGRWGPSAHAPLRGESRVLPKRSRGRENRARAALWPTRPQAPAWACRHPGRDPRTQRQDRIRRDSKAGGAQKEKKKESFSPPAFSPNRHISN